MCGVQLGANVVPTSTLEDVRIVTMRLLDWKITL
jgi:hypothetical protein